MNESPSHGPLSGEAVRLLEALLTSSNGVGRTQVSASSLVKESGLTQGGLTRARAELARSGLLRVEPGLSRNGRRGANVYILNLAAIQPASRPSIGDETDRIGTTLHSDPGSLVAGEVPAPSGRHRNASRGFWSRLFRKPTSS